MTSDEATIYVEGAACIQGFTLSADQLARVAAVFVRNAEMAALVMEFELPETAEPAPQFRP
jgi:hypothetical protein